MVGHDRTTGDGRLLTTTWPVVAVVAALLFSGLAPAATSAQSTLERVEELTRFGRTEEARVTLMEWWDEERPDASRRDRQRGLWLRGRLTVDPVQAELDFRRLTVLYPSGQFTPDALLRLAQASWAMGNEQEARNYVSTLERDHPRSDARDRARIWLASAGPLPPAGDTPTPASSRIAERGTAEAPPASTPDRTPPTAEPPVATGNAPITGSDDAGDDTPAAVMNYYVQLGAFGEPERAMALYEEVVSQGVDARVVRVVGSRFTHVRVGRFANRAEAVEVLEALTADGVNAALVRDDRPEEPIRD